MCKTYSNHQEDLFDSFFILKWTVGSFESPNLYLHALNFINSIAALLRYVILAQTNPIYVVLFEWHKLSNGNHFSLQSDQAAIFCIKVNLDHVQWLPLLFGQSSLYLVNWYFSKRYDKLLKCCFTCFLKSTIRGIFDL